MVDPVSRGLGRAWSSQADFSQGASYLRARVRARDVDAIDGVCRDLLDHAARDERGYRQVDGFVREVGGLWILGDRAKPFWTLAYHAPDGCLIVEDLDKELLDGGRPHSQAEHRVLVQAAGRCLQGLPDYTCRNVVLSGAREHPLIGDRIEAIRTGDEVGMRRYELLDSQTVYTLANQPDRFHPHGVGAQGAELALAGSCGLLRDLADMALKSRVLFGTADVGAVADALGWIGNRKDSFVWRFEEQEKADLDVEGEWVVGLGIVDVVGIALNVVVDVGSDGVARGWFRRYTQNFLTASPAISDRV